MHAAPDDPAAHHPNLVTAFAVPGALPPGGLPHELSAFIRT
ncbi:hypothetical protein [Streptomyces sp. AC555_RSS877]|nr:hypothetical protein [Streptomyces sp. AC555_RSS877]